MAKSIKDYFFKHGSLNWTPLQTGSFTFYLTRFLFLPSWTHSLLKENSLCGNKQGFKKKKIFCFLISVCALMCSLGHLLNILFILTCLFIWFGGNEYCCILCNSVLEWYLCLLFHFVAQQSILRRPSKCFSYSLVSLTKVGLIFSHDSSKLSKFHKTLQTRKLLIVTSIAGQKKKSNGENN